MMADGPVAIAVDPNTNMVYVANYLSNNAFVIDEYDQQNNSSSC